MSAVATFQFHIDGHDVDIIEVDGVDVQRVTVKSFPIAAGQRYSVLIKTRNDTLFNYAIHGDMIMVHDMPHDVPHDMPHGTPSMTPMPTMTQMPHMPHTPATTQMPHMPHMPHEPDMPNMPNMTDPQLHVTGTIIYNPSAPLAPTESPGRPQFDDATLLVPIEPLATSPADQQFTLTAEMRVLDDNIFRPIFNNITYVKPKVPSLYTALSMGNLSSNAEVYGKHTLPIVIKHNSWAEIVINNNDAGDHPFHLHGHVFQVVGRTQSVYDGRSLYPYFNLSNPLRRDTIMVPAHTSTAIRFQANNPGVWFFHCHVEWHLEAGMAATVIEAPEVLSSVLKVDRKYLEQCAALGIPFEGNAAGNQGLNMTGENEGPKAQRSHAGRCGSSNIAFTLFAAILSLVVVVGVPGGAW
ncbi:hypothetical protein BGZ72_010256 [Mortierella alpina]|nr:hypothetical protein BGZ72_010256 [Mortierella alpina]